MAYLTVEKGADKGETREIQGGRFVVGTSDDVDFQVHEKNLAPEHFAILKKGNQYFLNVPGDGKEVYLNGSPVNGAKLENEDRIEVGETIFSFLTEESYRERRGVVGNRIGGYEIKEEIGQGGMGTVYRALQVRLDRIVAFKILSRDLTGDRKFIEMFIEEARTAAKLNHPKVVQVYDVARADDVFYMSMEYLPGGSVRDLLSEEGELHLDRALDMIRDAAEGLEFAREKGLVHRDIKPDNLMLTDQETVKIIDLGLAHPEEVRDDQADGKVIGTPNFLAPEQARQEKVDHRTDLYALGSTLFRMIAGEMPFKGDSSKDIIKMKLDTSPPDLRQYREDLPDWIAELTRDLMQVDPDDRPESAARVIERMDENRTESDSKEVREQTSRSGLYGIVAGLLTLLIAGGVAASMFLGPDSTNTGDNGSSASGGNDTVQTPPDGQTQQQNSSFNVEPLWNEARQRYEEAMETEEVTVIREAIESHERFLQSFPEEDRAGDVQEQLRELEQLEYELTFRQDLSEHQTELESRLENLRNVTIDSTRDASRLLNSEIPAVRGMLEELQQLAGEIRDETEKTEVLDRTETRLANLASFESRVQRLLEHLKSFEQLMGQNQFLEARTAVRDMQNLAFSDSQPFQESISAVRTQFQETVQTHINKHAEEITSLLEENNFEEARNRVESLASRIPGDNQEKMKELKAQIDQQEQAYRQRQRARKIRQEREQFQSELVRILYHFENREPERVRNILDRLPSPEFQEGSDLAAFMTFLYRQYETLYTLMKNRNSTLTGKTLSSPDWEEDRTVRSISESSAEIEVMEGAQIRIEWKEVPIENLLTFLEEHLPEKQPAERVALSVYYFLYSHRNPNYVNRAREHLNRAALPDEDQPVEDPGFEIFRQVLFEDFTPFREQLAEQGFLVIKRNREEYEPEELVDRIQFFRDRYGNTTTYQEFREELTGFSDTIDEPAPEQEGRSGDSEGPEGGETWDELLSTVDETFQERVEAESNRTTEAFREAEDYMDLGRIQLYRGEYTKAYKTFNQLFQPSDIPHNLIDQIAGRIEFGVLVDYYRSAVLSRQTGENIQVLMTALNEKVETDEQRQRIRGLQEWTRNVSTFREREKQQKEKFASHGYRRFLRELVNLYGGVLPNDRERLRIILYIEQERERWNDMSGLYEAAVRSARRIGCYDLALEYLDKLQNTTRDSHPIAAPDSDLRNELQNLKQQRE